MRKMQKWNFYIQTRNWLQNEFAAIKAETVYKNKFPATKPKLPATKLIKSAKKNIYQKHVS
ncbi:hypothetical protein D0463_10210 [Bacillus sp. V59.32b]|nr:hypothetical protein D0463_10210 [Bacillus sp. V59.32b]